MIGEVQKLRGEDQGKDLNLHFSGCVINDSRCNSKFVGHLGVSIVNVGDVVAKTKSKVEAHKVNKILKQDGTVQEYYDAFDSLFKHMGLDERYAVSLFVWGLHPEIEKWVKVFKPKKLSDAYCLAKLQELTI